MISRQNRFLDVETAFRHTFFLASCNVCPMVIPEIFVQTQGSDYWRVIHFWHASKCILITCTSRNWLRKVTNDCVKQILSSLTRSNQGCWTQNKVFKRIRNAALLLNQNKNQINSNDWLEKVKLHLDPAKNQNKNTFSGRSWKQENGRVSNTRNHQSRGVSPIQNYFQRTTKTPCSCNGNEFAFSNLSSLMPSVFVTTFIVITDRKTKLV